MELLCRLRGLYRSERLASHPPPPSSEDEFSDVEGETTEGARKYNRPPLNSGHFETDDPLRFCITSGTGDC